MKTRNVNNKFRFRKKTQRPKYVIPNANAFRIQYKINKDLGLRHAFVYRWVEPYSTVYEMEVITLLPRELLSILFDSLVTRGWLVYHDGVLGGSYSKAAIF